MKCSLQINLFYSKKTTNRNEIIFRKLFILTTTLTIFGYFNLDKKILLIQTTRKIHEEDGNLHKLFVIDVVFL